MAIKEKPSTVPAELNEMPEVKENQAERLPENGQPDDKETVEPVKKKSTKTVKKKPAVKKVSKKELTPDENIPTEETSGEIILPDTPSETEPSNETHVEEPEIEQSLPETSEGDVTNISKVSAKDSVNDPDLHHMLPEVEDSEIEEDDLDVDHIDEIHEEELNYDQLTRIELVELLEALVQSGDLDEIKKKIAPIKVAFVKQSKAEQEKALEENLKDKEEDDSTEAPRQKDEVEERFNAAFEIYREKRQAFNEQQELLKQENLEKKKLILEEIKALIESEESLKKTYDEFRILQDKWREIGLVPKAELNNLWQNYHFLVEKFFDKVKINKELRDLDLKKNLETKIELCEKAEELLLESSVHKAFKKLQNYHQQWKESGPVPQDKKNEIWERFKNASDKINQLRREHYDSLKDEQTSNFLAKSALCEKAEEVLKRENNSVKEWQESTNQISEILKVWKTIGPAPRIQNDQIWERFKSYLNAFFSAQKEHFQAIKDEQMNNYNLKLDLCKQAEAIKDSTEWRQTSQELINLQKEWKQIGPVPKRQSDKIWKRFRAACDHFFKSKSEYFSSIKQHETDNLALREELIRKIEAYEYEKDKNKNLEILKEFQREWTEIGHVPFKDKDRLQTEFRNAINKQLDKLKINKAEMQAINYKQRIDEIKDRPNAGRIINNEITFLQTKRKKMEDEVNLWENNIGFLANSKKADLLKQEFEKKIGTMKSEINILTEKIRLLEKES
jgi:hypothetical protein